MADDRPTQLSWTGLGRGTDRTRNTPDPNTMCATRGKTPGQWRAARDCRVLSVGRRATESGGVRPPRSRMAGEACHSGGSCCERVCDQDVLCVLMCMSMFMSFFCWEMGKQARGLRGRKQREGKLAIARRALRGCDI